jgi:hypothetical protein
VSAVTAPCVAAGGAFRGAGDRETAESGFAAVAALSRRLRMAGIESLLLELRRRIAVRIQAADYYPVGQLYHTLKCY